MTIASRTVATTIWVGNGAVGALTFGAGIVTQFVDGFSLITIGRSDGTGVVTINTQAFNDPVTIRGGAVTVAGSQTRSTTGTDDLTLLGTSVTLTGNASIASGNIQIGPQSLTDTIGIGTGAGTFNVSNASLAYLLTTSGSFRFGRLASENGDNSFIDINTTNVFADPIALFAKSITVNGALNAGASDVSFSVAQVSTGIFTVDNTITTTGTSSAIGEAGNNATFDINQTGQTLTIIGGASASNTLESPIANNMWRISSNNGGTLTGGGTFTFSNIQNLTGEAMADTFAFDNTFGVTGAIIGGSTPTPVNRLDYTNFHTATVNFNAGTESGTASNITGGFTQIQSVIGVVPSTPPAPTPAPLSSTSPIATVAIADNATTSSDFFGELDNGGMGAKGNMGSATHGVTALAGFIMKTPSFVENAE